MWGVDRSSVTRPRSHSKWVPYCIYNTEETTYSETRKLCLTIKMLRARRFPSWADGLGLFSTHCSVDCRGHCYWQNESPDSVTLISFQSNTHNYLRCCLSGAMLQPADKHCHMELKGKGKDRRAQTLLLGQLEELLQRLWDNGCKMHFTAPDTEQTFNDYHPLLLCVVILIREWCYELLLYNLRICSWKKLLRSSRVTSSRRNSWQVILIRVLLPIESDLLHF